MVLLLLLGMVVVDEGVGAEGRRVVGVGLEYLSFRGIHSSGDAFLNAFNLMFRIKGCCTMIQKVQ